MIGMPNCNYNIISMRYCYNSLLYPIETLGAHTIAYCFLQNGCHKRLFHLVVISSRTSALTFCSFLSFISSASCSICSILSLLFICDPLDPSLVLSLSSLYIMCRYYRCVIVCIMYKRHRAVSSLRATAPFKVFVILSGTPSF